MSYDKARERLAAVESATNVADVIAWATGPARPDLAAALDVIAAARHIPHATDCAQRAWAHLVLDGHRHDECPSCSCWRHDLGLALDAFEALP